MTGESTGLPFFSVVMPTYERRESLRRTITVLAECDYPPDRMELVVVCDGCTDGSAEMVRALKVPFRVVVLEQDNEGPASARNLALAHARGPLILFLDDDVLASRQLLLEHAKGHDCDENRVVIGALLPPGKVRRPWVAWELSTVVNQYRAMEAGEYRPSPRQFYTGNASLRMVDVIGSGGFDTGFRRAEDVELAFRLQRRGLQFVFRRSASALHVADRSFGSWLQAAYLYGRNDVILGLHRGRPDMLVAVAEEFWERHPLTQKLIRWSLGRRLLQRLVPPLGGTAAKLAHRTGRIAFAHRLCSAMFNVEYWRGVSDELGGPDEARRLIGAGAPGWAA